MELDTEDALDECVVRCLDLGSPGVAAALTEWLSSTVARMGDSLSAICAAMLPGGGASPGDGKTAPVWDMGGDDPVMGLPTWGEDAMECAVRAIADRAAGAGEADEIGSTISRDTSLDSIIASTASSSTGGIATSTASLLLRTCLASRCSMSLSKMLASVAAVDAAASLGARECALTTLDPLDDVGPRSEGDWGACAPPAARLAGPADDSPSPKPGSYLLIKDGEIGEGIGGPILLLARWPLFGWRTSLALAIDGMMVR